MNPETLRQVQELKQLVETVNEYITSLHSEGLYVRMRFAEGNNSRDCPRLEFYAASETIDYLKL